MKPPAIGYVRADISGTSQAWHEKLVRSRAHQLGYDLRKVVVFNAHTDDPTTRLTRIARKERVDAVVMLSLEHLETNEPPRALLLVADVITVSPEHHHTRDLTPPEPPTPTSSEGGETVQTPGPDGNSGNSNASSDNSVNAELYGSVKQKSEVLSSVHNLTDPQ